MSVLRMILGSFLMLSLLQGCGLMRPPGVEEKARSSAESFRVPLPAELGLTDFNDGATDAAGAPLAGTVTANLSLTDPNDRWIYWKAGTRSMIYSPAPTLVVGMDWDMRITKRIPLIGSNGGKTATDIGAPQAVAAFAVIPDAWAPNGQGYIPRQIDEIKNLPLVEDRFESLEFEGLKTKRDYQNPLVNTIGSGVLKKYFVENNEHKVELSRRIFILRTADGSAYYALQFYLYDQAMNVFAFQWRKLL